MNIDLKHFNKTITILMPDSGSTIAHDMSISHQFYENEMLEYIRQVYPKQKIIIDAGAHCGNHVLFYANFLQYDHIYAFEPYLKSFNILKENVSKYDNITCSNKGLFNESCKALMTRYHEEPGCTCFTKSETSEDGELIALDSLNLKNVSLIKFDMEGPERNAVLGSINTIQESKPVLFIESSPYGNSMYPPHEEIKILEVLSPLGYIIGNQWDGSIMYEYFIPGLHR